VADPGFAKGGHAEREAGAYNGSLGAEPPARSRGRVPGGVRGAKLLKLKAFCPFSCTKDRPKVKD